MGRGILLLGAAGLLLVTACGGDDGEDGAGRGSSGTRRTDEEPPATDAEGVRPYIEDLLHQHEDVVNQILANPGVARDRDDLLIESYVHLFAPDSDVPDQVLDSFVQMADAGQHMEPYEPGRLINALRLDGEVEALTDDGETVDDGARFPLCVEVGYRTLDGNGQVVEEHPSAEHPGEGFAERVDGEWHLWRIDTDMDTSGCATPGGS